MTASTQFKEENFVMYEIKDCAQCGTKYKEMYGFVGHGVLGEFNMFYSDTSCMCYCPGCIPCKPHAEDDLRLCCHAPTEVNSCAGTGTVIFH